MRQLSKKVHNWKNKTIYYWEFWTIKRNLIGREGTRGFHFFSTNHAIYWITSIVLFPKFKKFIDSMNQSDSDDMQTECITDDLVNRIISSLIHNPTL